MLTGGEKRLVGVTNGGHLTPTDLCQKNSDGNNAIQVLHNHHWCGVDSVAIVGLPTLFDCGANNFDWQVGVKDVAYASTAAFEETLTCRPDVAMTMTNMMTVQPTIGDFKETKQRRPMPRRGALRRRRAPCDSRTGQRINRKTEGQKVRGEHF